MKLSRTRGMTVNLGNFESLRFEASVTLDHGDLYSDDADCPDLMELAAELSAACLMILNDQLIEEIRDARELTSEDKSFIIASFTEQRRPRTPKRRS